jgi:hypothetical protein
MPIIKLIGMPVVRGLIFDGTRIAQVNPHTTINIVSLLIYLLTEAVRNIKNPTAKRPYALNTPKKTFNNGRFAVM